MTTTHIRRIIGITALVLWVIAIVPRFILGKGERLVFQLENWALLFAFVLSILYMIMRTIYVVKKDNKHKLYYWLRCVGVGIILLTMSFCTGCFFLDHKLWNNNDYIVYDEFGGVFASDDVLYKRNGLVENRLYVVGNNFLNLKPNHVDYTIYEPLDLIKMENEGMDVEYNTKYHETTFYRLSDGHRYNQNQNDSLLTLVGQK